VTRQVNKNARSAAAMCGVAIKSEQTGGRTDPGDLALGNAAIPTWLNLCTPHCGGVVMVIVFWVVSYCHHMMGFWE
jgi:hypothetical protein